LFQPFGKKRKRIAIILAFGLSSFFVPLIKTVPPVMARTQWSTFMVVYQLSQGNLPHSVTDLLITPIEVAAIYLMLAVLLVGVLRSCWLASLCIALNPLWWFGDSDDSNQLFYGSPSFLDFSWLQRRVDVSQLFITLAAVSLVVLFVSLNSTLDE
jgi:hypothetical protein